ncbi:MAG: 4'-phosphopantetheinyl transferase family protein [Acidimicrobiia bacterium]
MHGEWWSRVSSGWVSADEGAGKVTVTAHRPYHSLLGAPADLPPFAAYEVSLPEDPLPTLAPGEEALLSSAMVQSRKDELARGRAAAHACLRSLNLDRGPILSGVHREPIWPSGARGSIAHTAGMAVAMAAPATLTDGVGVDIELFRTAPELRGQVLLPEERSWIDCLPISDRQAMTIAVFSAKESIFKAFFPRRREFFGFEIASVVSTASGFEARLAEGFDTDYPPDRTLAVGSSWFANLVLTWVVLPSSSPSRPAYARQVEASSK